MKRNSGSTKSTTSYGFTTLEITVVVLVVAVIVVVGIIRFGNLGGQERVARAVAELIVSDLAFSQELAVSRGKAVIVTFTPGADGGDGGGRRGYGHDPNVRGEGMNGNGRGHGYGWGHMHHNCGPNCGGGDAGGYSIQFVDGTPIPYPESALVTDLRGQVTITTAMTLQFDSSGRLITPNFTWGDGQTEANAVILNDNVIVAITRETGKTRVATN